jgi:YidC/Oxa1 family membrane protein insertase
MSPNNNSQNQSRFFTALILSMGVLLLWSFLFPAKKPDANNNANVQQQAATQQQTAAPTTPETPVQQVQNQAPATAADATPNRVITVTTPLYSAKFDSKGAVANSWVLLKNVSEKGEKPLFSAASTKGNPQPLELIPEEARKRRELPLKLVTGDANFDQLLADRNYQIVGADADEIVLSGNESRKIDFVLRDEANQVEVVKSLTLRADSYISDLQTKLTRGGQPVTNAKLQIGASVGDQGIKSFNYYAIESEAVATVNGDDVERHIPTSFAGTNNGRLDINGTVEWAGVGDTYFAMAAIPSQPLGGLTLQTIPYEVALAEPRTDGIWGFLTGAKVNSEKRHLTSALVPISADGATLTKIYTGTKDHFLLLEAGKQLSQQVGRTVDLENFINYGWIFPSIVRAIAVPIIWSLNALSQFTNSYGIAILVFTFLFFTILFPMRWYQSKSFKKAAKNAPKMKELQDKLKDLQAKKVPMDDPRMRELQMEQLKLTKDAIPLGGCLPLLLQFPLLIAVYTAITISLDFRQAAFMWLPDLAAGDPYHILEFAFAGSMVLAMKFTPTAPAMTEEQKMQQKMMLYMMPAMMLFVMWGAPSGLLVYWLAGNIIGFGQQMIINRLNKTDDDQPNATTTEQPRTMTKKEMKTSLSPSS